MRITSNVFPKTITKLGDNTYYYNYDIKSELVEVQDMNTEETKVETQYSYIQAHLYGQPNYKDCVKAIVRQYLSADEEFDLINSYNSYNQGLSDDETVISEYTNYLNLLKEIKAKVKEDFAKL